MVGSLIWLMSPKRSVVVVGGRVISILSEVGGARLVFALGLLEGEAEQVGREGEGWVGGGVAVL